jgi:hypothetical protein
MLTGWGRDATAASGSARTWLKSRGCGQIVDHRTMLDSTELVIDLNSENN